MALLESGVTVPMSPEERLASISFSSQRGVTIVSLLRRTTSRDDALIPRFTLSTNPRRVSLRRICAERPLKEVTIDSTASSCGPSMTRMRP